MHEWTRPVRVLVADDYEAARRALAIFLGVHDELELVGEARTGAEAVRLAGAVEPDIILLNLDMPDMNGLLATSTIKHLYPEVKVIVFCSPYADLDDPILAAGASRVMRKSVRGDELLAAIRGAMGPARDEGSQRI